jgi:hypothetical protein
MYGTTTVNNLEIIGNITYKGHMLTFCGETTTTPCIVSSAFSHNEWLFIIMIFIVILSIPLWRFIFQGWTNKQ